MPGKENKTELILSGDPAKDFAAFLNSKEKPYDIGLELISRYTQNRVLLQFLQKNRDEKSAPKKLLDNIKIISRQWLKK